MNYNENDYQMQKWEKYCRQMQTMNRALYKNTACNIEKNDTLSLKNWKLDFMSLYTTCI